MNKTYRKGAVGAMMDEYERAAGELVRVVERLSDAEFEVVRDPETPNEECRSIQTVAHHVARSGYAYANYLRVAFSLPTTPAEIPVVSRAAWPGQLAEMLATTAAALDGRWEMSDEAIQAVRIPVRWGPIYDLEQLLEHAIVHVLRHRRQIERFLGQR
jgi:uncharacterized damage-inducible protein DinB